MTTAAEALTIALLELADRGDRTPCQGRRRNRWTSDDATERRWAASVCLSLACPVQKQCGDAAAEGKESWGVWGGRDLTAIGHHKRTAIGQPKRRAS